MKQSPKKKADDTLERLLNSIDFTPETVAPAAAENTLLFRDAALYRAAVYGERAQADLDFERARATRALEIRNEYRAAGEKGTEKLFEELLLVDDTLLELREKLMQADVANELSKSVLEIFRMRRDCLQIVQQVVGAENAMSKIAESEREKLLEKKQKLYDRYSGLKQQSK